MSSTVLKAIAFLRAQQREDGSFTSFSSNQAAVFANTKEYSSLFPVALILQALHDIPQSDVIRNDIFAFLQKEKSKHWTFNYWQKNSAEYTELPYPDDLDDTACALAALTLHSPEYVGAKALAHITAILTLLEDAEGGPYRTWVVPPQSASHWKDVDVAVNSNIGYFLSLHDIYLPNLTTLIEQAIENEEYQSKYYPSIYPVIYFISRFYKGDMKNIMRDFLLSTESGWKTPLDTALALSSLITLGADTSRLTSLAASIESTQLPDGSWPAHAFCFDPAIDGVPHYAGSQALTTAFCLEALHRFYQLQAHTVPISQKASSHPDQAIKQSIETLARKKANTLPDPAKNLAQQAITQILSSTNADQIVLLAHFVRNAMGEKSVMSDSLIRSLGLANLCGWIAYTIYDDILDQDTDQTLLPIANIFSRHAVATLKSLPLPPTSLSSIIETTIDRIDSANAWELHTCRFTTQALQQYTKSSIPSYGDLAHLANKSLGHTIGPALLALSLGYTEESPEAKQLVSAFTHFLIGRQLNDDAHDWQEDLEKGYVNAAGTVLLQQFFAHHQEHTLDLTNKKTIATLQEFFWEHTITDICKMTLHHINQGQALLTSHPLIQYPQHITPAFESVANTANRTLHEQSETREFIQEYSQVLEEPKT